MDRRWDETDETSPRLCRNGPGESISHDPKNSSDLVSGHGELGVESIVRDRVFGRFLGRRQGKNKKKKQKGNLKSQDMGCRIAKQLDSIRAMGPYQVGYGGLRLVMSENFPPGFRDS
jgi:hypothetical protein